MSDEGSGYNFCYLAELGTIQMYLAPVLDINEVLKNNLFAADRPNGKGSVVKDKRMYRHEITIQGDFLPSTDMRPDHRAAVQSIFSRAYVSPIHQYRRLRALALSVGGQYDLYLGDDQYSATSQQSLIYRDDGHVLPQVTIDEVRGAWDPQKTRISYTLKLIAGFRSSSGEEDES